MEQFGQIFLGSIKTEMSTWRDGQSIRTQVGSIWNAFGKFKEVLSAPLVTPTVSKISLQRTVNAEPQVFALVREKSTEKLGRPKHSTTACRICLKTLKSDDVKKTCAKCRFSICEDCFCYYPETENEKPLDWKCSVCRRKLNSYSTVTQRFSKSLSNIPEGSLVKLKSNNHESKKRNKEYHGARSDGCPISDKTTCLPRQSSYENVKPTKRESEDPETISEQTLPRKAFPISGDFYYDSITTELESLPCHKSENPVYAEDVGNVTEVNQQWSQGRETFRKGAFISPWLTFGVEDLNSTLRRLLIHTEAAVPDSPSLIAAFIQRDLTDRSPTTRGLGMHVSGGRVGTFIYWIEPGGPAERAGLQEGDWILEWNNSSLINRTFEEVTWIIGDMEPVVNLLIKRPPERKERQLPHIGSSESGLSKEPSTSTGREILTNLK